MVLAKGRGDMVFDANRTYFGFHDPIDLGKVACLCKQALELVSIDPSAKVSAIALSQSSGREILSRVLG